MQVDGDAALPIALFIDPIPAQRVAKWQHSLETDALTQSGLVPAFTSCLQIICGVWATGALP
jgi:hypothetical protein